MQQKSPSDLHELLSLLDLLATGAGGAAAFSVVPNPAHFALSCAAADVVVVAAAAASSFSSLGPERRGP